MASSAANLSKIRKRMPNKSAAQSIAILLEEHMTSKGWTDQQKDHAVAKASTRVRKVIGKNAKF